MRRVLLCTAVLSVLALAAAGQDTVAYRCYYGNLHSHTSYSDGESVPEVAYQYARTTAGIHVLAVTDHNNSPDDLTEALYQRTHHVADSMTVPGVFVALAGQEIGNSGGFGHIACFEAATLSPYFNTWGDLVPCYRWIREQNAPAMYNHPTLFQDRDFSYFNFYSAYNQSMDLLEVVNQNGNYELQYLLALNRGWQLGASANQDNHDPDWGNDPNGAGYIPLTGIWADTLTQEAVLDALQQRRTFAMLSKPAAGRIQLSLTADGHWMGERFLRDAGIVDLVIDARATANAFRRLDLYADGIRVDSLQVNQSIVSWRLSRQVGPGSHYIFVKTTQADNATCWSSPVFIEVPPVDPYLKVVTWPTPVTEGARIVYRPIEGVRRVTVDIYNLAGARVWHTQTDNPKASIYWEGRDSRGDLMPNGVYIIMIEQQSPIETTLTKGKTMVAR